MRKDHYSFDCLIADELCNVYGSTDTYGNCAVTDAKDPLPLRLQSQVPLTLTGKIRNPSLCQELAVDTAT